jgi:transposase-like protein
MGRQGYPAEFCRRALDLVAAGKTVAEVARLLEVSDQSIYTWRRQEQIDNGDLAARLDDARNLLSDRGVDPDVRVGARRATSG